MIHFTRKLNLMMLIMCCIAQTTQSSDVRDQDGRTELMNYVREQELEIEIRKIDLDKLWNTYFYKKKFAKGSMQVDGRTVHVYESIALRKIYTTDENVAQYRIVEDEFNLFVDGIIENIKIMVLNGANLQARDIRGKSISDYCYTKKIYDTVRNLGAPRSLFEEDCLIVAIGLLTIVTVLVSANFLITCYKICHQR